MQSQNDRILVYAHFGGNAREFGGLFIKSFALDYMYSMDGFISLSRPHMKTFKCKIFDERFLKVWTSEVI